MSKPSLPAVAELPVMWQSASIDVESVAPLRQFNIKEAYDVANMSAVICVQVPETRAYRLLLSCNVESGTRATVRVMSADDDAFDNIANFNRIPKEEAADFIPLLNNSGLVSADSTEQQKLAYIRANFKQAVVSIPAGQQKLRVHASQKLLPNTADPKAYSLKVFAPLLGFTIAGGQTNLSVVVTFPPSFEGFPVVIEAPVVEALAGQPMPGEAVPAFNGTIAAVPAFAWHWRNDPKVTINYRYS